MSFLKFISIFGLAVVIIIGIFFLTARSSTEVAVKITAEGFHPDEVTLKRGQSVTWVNEDRAPHWPASDLHPTHELYSEFDPKEPIPNGKSWKFRFEESGNWRYHDHLVPKEKGIIVVK